MTEEIWKPTKGYEKCYMISNYGRVKSLGRILHAKDGSIRHYKDRILSLKQKKGHGYVTVRLFEKDWKKSKHVDVHRLEALHFIPNPENHPVVNHRDSQRSNNYVDNLEWVTISSNLKHNGSHLKEGEKRRKKVFQFTMEGEFIRSWSWLRSFTL